MYFSTFHLIIILRLFSEF